MWKVSNGGTGRKNWLPSRPVGRRARNALCRASNAARVPITGTRSAVLAWSEGSHFSELSAGFGMPRRSTALASATTILMPQPKEEIEWVSCWMSPKKLWWYVFSNFPMVVNDCVLWEARGAEVLLHPFSTGLVRLAKTTSPHRCSARKRWHRSAVEWRRVWWR